MKRRVFHIQATDSHERLGTYLSRVLALDAPAVEVLLGRGAVYRQGRRCADGEAVLSAGHVLTVVLEESGQSALAPNTTERSQPAILFEDSSLVAVNKPAGWTAQPTEGRVGESLLDWATVHLGHGAGLVHRLDRETSGVTLFGKVPPATSALAGAFRAGAVHKRYLAVVPAGLPEAGRVELPLSKDPSRPGRYRATKAANGLPARTDYVRLAQVGGFALVVLYPKTGRTHQLRAHLTALGTPIAGDRRYGGAPELEGMPADRCLLHAQAIQLPHPYSQAVLQFEAPLPADMDLFFRAAGLEAPRGPWTSPE